MKAVNNAAFYFKTIYMKHIQLIIIVFLIGTVTSCIKDDFIDDSVDPILKISTQIDTLALNTSFQFESTYLNNVGQVESVPVTWESSDQNIISIDNTGLSTANSVGTAEITAKYESADNQIIQDNISVVVGNNTVIMNQTTSGTIVTTSSYELTGSFEFSEVENGVRISIDEDYKASTALPGLYIYLSNNKNTIADALEISAVTVFEGAHTYDIENVGFQDYQFILYYCKPFNVKVGEAIL